jgi:hypothetical protein
MILNDLYQNQSMRYKWFYPFYFQRRRDDTNLSRMNYINDIHIIACFARRPKTDSVSSNKTIITFRNSIFEQTYFLNKFDIPVIAGTPLGTRIDTIGFGSKCQWFNVKPYNNNESIEYAFVNEKLQSSCQNNSIILLDKNQIYNILTSAPKHSWIDTLELLNKWNSTFTNHYFMHHTRNLFYSTGGIKPIFIAYQLNDNLL